MDIETMGEGSFEPEVTETPETSTENPTVEEGTNTTPTIEGTAEGDPAAPVEFTPNYKFSVMGKDMEVPEIFRALMTNAENEKLVREHMEKSFGIDHVKSKNETLKQQLEALNTEYTPLKKDLALIKTFVENNDLDSFFNAFGLTDEAIVNHAMSRLEYMQMSPEKKQAADRQRQQNAQFYKTQQELSEMKNTQSQNELQATVHELQSTIQAPHIAPIVESFNARAGKADAFERAVIAHAQNYFAMYKQDLSVPQAIESFIKTFGLQAASPQATPQAAPASAPAERAPTLPKSGSGTVAPVKAKVKSIDDIRKMSQQ